MSNRSVITLFQQMSEQLESIVAMLGTVRLALSYYRINNPADENGADVTIREIAQVTQEFDGMNADLNDSVRKLRQRIDQLNLLYDITNQLNDQISLNQVIELTMDAMWQKAPLNFAVVILGDTELGPYHYKNMRGVSDAWRFLGRECPFPLWGVLARALIPHLDPEKPDYLIVDDMRTEQRPLPEEFPWMKREGSLMILPLRIQKTVSGALLLGRNEVEGFSNPELCEDYTEIAKSAARALQLAQVHQELQERISQLVGLQLFTRSMTNAKSFDEVIELLTQGVIEMAGKATVHIMIDPQFTHDRLHIEPPNQLVESFSSNPKTFQIYVTSLYENQKSTELSAYIYRLIEWTMQAGQPVFYDPQVAGESLEQFYYNESGRALLVPIVNNERTIGVIHIVAPDRPQPFDESDMVMLRTIANTTVMILNNLQA
ncbi:MAG: GAF domain-containing protein [Chloroflexi bacterium]|nr:GAF domain-containing protein [Chloroflexota bacterium]